jgi:hypothetical protein
MHHGDTPMHGHTKHTPLSLVSTTPKILSCLAIHPDYLSAATLLVKLHTDETVRRESPKKLVNKPSMIIDSSDGVFSKSPTVNAG